MMDRAPKTNKHYYISKCSSKSVVFKTAGLIGDRLVLTEKSKMASKMAAVLESAIQDSMSPDGHCILLYI